MAALQEAAKKETDEITTFGDTLENFVVAVFNEQSVKRGLWVADEQTYKKATDKAKAALIELLTGAGKDE